MLLKEKGKPYKITSPERQEIELEVRPALDKGKGIAQDPQDEEMDLEGIDYGY